MDKPLTAEEQRELERLSQIQEANERFRQVYTNARNESEIAVKITKKNTPNKVEAVIIATIANSIPIVQVSNYTCQQWCNGEVVVTKDLFKDYDFNVLYAFSGKSGSHYNREMERLIAVDKATLPDGNNRLRYCFSVIPKMSFSSISFFIDSFTKDFIILQGLDLFLGDGVINNLAFSDKRLAVKKISGTKLGTVFNDTSDMLSPGSLLTIPSSNNEEIILGQRLFSIDDIYTAFCTNNNPTASYINIPSAAMYSGKDGNYQQVMSNAENITALKANTPPLLMVKLGSQANLTPNPNPNVIPNVTIGQMNALNNFYFLDNGYASGPASNFVALFPVY